MEHSRHVSWHLLAILAPTNQCVTVHAPFRNCIRKLRDFVFIRWPRSELLFLSMLGIGHAQGVSELSYTVQGAPGTSKTCASSARLGLLCSVFVILIFRLVRLSWYLR